MNTLSNLKSEAKIRSSFENENNIIKLRGQLDQDIYKQIKKDFMDSKINP